MADNEAFVTEYYEELLASMPGAEWVGAPGGDFKKGGRYYALEPAQRKGSALPVYSSPYQYQDQSPINIKEYFCVRSDGLEPCLRGQIERIPDPDDLLPLRLIGASWVGRNIICHTRSGPGEPLRDEYIIDESQRTKQGKDPVFSKTDLLLEGTQTELYCLDGEGNLKKVEEDTERAQGDVIAAARERLGLPPLEANAPGLGHVTPQFAVGLQPMYDQPQVAAGQQPAPSRTSKRERDYSTDGDDGDEDNRKRRHMPPHQ